MATQRLRWPCSVQAIDHDKCYILDTMTSGKYFNGQWQKHWSRVLEISQEDANVVTELFQLDSEASTMAMTKENMIIAANGDFLFVDLGFLRSNKINENPNQRKIPERKYQNLPWISTKILTSFQSQHRWLIRRKLFFFLFLPFETLCVFFLWFLFFVEGNIVKKKQFSFYFLVRIKTRFSLVIEIANERESLELFSLFFLCFCFVTVDCLILNIYFSALLVKINQTFFALCSFNGRFTVWIEFLFQMLAANGIFARFTIMSAHLTILIMLLFERVSPRVRLFDSLRSIESLGKISRCMSISNGSILVDQHQVPFDFSY